MSDTPMILEWVDGVQVVRPMTTEEQAEMLAPPSRELWRQSASIPKSDFCVRLFAAGVLTEQEAIDGGRGVWPASFAGVVSGLPAIERVQVAADFGAVTHIRRAHRMIDGLAAIAGMTPEQVDDLFGWHE